MSRPIEEREFPASSAARVHEQDESGLPVVLVVDDEEMVLLVTERGLKSLGYDVVTATGGADAIACYERGEGDRIACVLLDVTMPPPNGSETFAAIRAMHPDARIILMSGYSPNDVLPKLESPPSAFLQKPYTLRTLQETLDAVLS